MNHDLTPEEIQTLRPNLQKYLHLFDTIANGEPIWKIALYVRLSRHDTKKTSIINQIRLQVEHLKELTNFVVVDIYIDESRTGTDFKRNDYLRFMDDVEDDIVNCMLVKHLARFARNTAQGLAALESFVFKYNLRFIALEYPKVDTYHNPKAITSAEVANAFNQAEDFARTTSLAVKKVFHLKQINGESTGGFAPYGLLDDPDGFRYLYDPVAGAVKQQIFDWSDEGYSDNAIAKMLTNKGVPNPTDYKTKVLGLNYHHPVGENNTGAWWPQTVSRILQDRTNIGDSVRGKTETFSHIHHKSMPKNKDEYKIKENVNPRTVSDEQFDRIQENKKARSRVTKTGEPHKFARIVCCANCKLGMDKNSSTNKKTGKVTHSLRCRAKHQLGETVCNQSVSINFDKLEHQVTEAIKMQLRLVVDARAIVERINEQPTINTQSERIEIMLKNTRDSMSKANRMIDDFYFDWKSGKITEDQFIRLNEKSQEEKRYLELTLAHLIRKQDELKKGINKNNEYFELFLKYKEFETLDRAMIQELIHKIYVNQDKTIDIEFTYQDQFELIYDFIQANQDLLTDENTCENDDKAPEQKKRTRKP